MSVAEIFEQARTLTAQERKELAKLLIDTLETQEPVSRGKTGAEIAAMLKEMEPIEFVDDHIIDPVEWLTVQRQKEADRLESYWGDDSD